MKIQEILVESQLQEGPILNKIGSAIGKGAGTLAKGVGSIAGGVAGLGSALAKGYKAGKSAVSMAGDDAADTPAGSETEPAGGGAATGSAPAAGASGGGAPAAKKKAPTSTFGKLSAAANSGEEQPSGAPAAPGAAAPAAPGAAAPAAPGAGAMGAMAGQLAKGGAATTTGEKPAPKKRAPKKPAAPSQAEIDADRERIMGATSDSIIRTKPMMAESFSLFRKR